MLETSFQPLEEGAPGWGQIAILPWDTDIFGFPVAAWQPGDPGAIAEDAEAFRKRFQAWAALHRVELVASTVVADDRAWQAILPELGFSFVEQTVRIRLRLQAFDAPPPATPVRLATPEDGPGLEEIAGSAFRHGRYHADPRFPRSLADDRYQYWVRGTFRSTDPRDRVYVLGRPGTVKGFFQLQLNEDRAETGIIAVAKALQGSPAGVELVIGTQLALKPEGVRWITSKVSAANVGLLNLVTSLGYRLRQPEATFHWHAPDAPHLLARGTIPR
jgi:hypothetical protein